MISKCRVRNYNSIHLAGENRLQDMNELYCARYANILRNAKLFLENNLYVIEMSLAI